MFRFLLSAASICALLTAALFFPGAISARRCPVRMPVTLLSLYRKSEFIYIGKFDKLEEGESAEELEDYHVIPIKKHFTISSSLKGESRKMLVLEETDYRYKGGGAVADAEPESESNEKVADEDTIEATTETEVTELPATEETEEIDETELKAGDTVLLFLNKNQDNDQIQLSDEVDGMKKMSSEWLAMYEARIGELNGIFAADEPAYSEIIAWLVRCAENPETRWEGTYDLLRSFENLDSEQELAKETAQTVDQEPADSEDSVIEREKKFDTGDVNFAKGLTEGEKLILTSVLLSRKRPASSNGQNASMARGDRELIELVKRWGDSKVAANFIEQLRYDLSDPTLSSELMSSIGSILGDEGLAEIANEYSGFQWESDDDFPEPETAEESTSTPDQDAPQDAGPTPETESDTESSPPTADAAVESAAAEDSSAPAPEKEQPKKKTYRELRSELIKKFLERAEKLMAARTVI